MDKIYQIEIRNGLDGKLEYHLPFSLLWSEWNFDLNSLAYYILAEVNDKIQKDNIYRKKHNIPEIEPFSKVQFYQFNSSCIIM